jgi:5-methylcytosine-specific restriction endonuclease McrA
MSDTLLLNADGNPVSLMPLSVIDWQEAIKCLVLEKASIIAWHEDWIVRSARWETPVPSILMLKEYMKPKTAIRFSRANVYLRDKYVCQYCFKKLDKKDCTLDHVLPVSKGGKSVFENSVTACSPCNANKGDKLEPKPKKKPHKPDYYELLNNRKQMPFNVRHEAWLEYLT